MAKSRIPKAVKAWVNAVDEAEKTYVTKMKEKDPRPGMWVYRKISNGMHWDGEKLIISGLAMKEMRNHSKMFDNFPKEYKYQGA